MEQVRRSLIYWAKGSKDNIEVLAFFIVAKLHADCHCTIKNFSINKMSAITGCSWATCKKYTQRLIDSKLCSYDKQRNSLSFGRISSGTKHRNIPVGGLDFRTLKAAKDSVRHLIHMLGIAAKRFVKEVIRAVNKPMMWPSKGMKDDRKKALALCKKFVWQNAHSGRYEYHELGKSYETIARELGVCVKTAMRIIKAGVHKHLFSKHNKGNMHWTKLEPGMEKYCYDSYTFIYKGFGCNVDANRYSLTKEWRSILCKDMGNKFQRPILEEEYDEYVKKQDENKRKFAKKYREGIENLSDEYNISVRRLYSFHYSLPKLCWFLEQCRTIAVAGNK